MRVLVDTHCWLWYLLAPDRLNDEAQEVLSSPDHQIYLSAASAWEIVVKFALGKLSIPQPPAEYIPARLAVLGHESLPILQHHVLQVERLPLHHRDPFDRILVAQAQIEDLRLLSADDALTHYDVSLFWGGR